MKSTSKSAGRTKVVVGASRSAKPAVRTKVAAGSSKAAKPTVPAPPPARGQIAMRAYELYARSGHQAGREVEFWLEAERQLQREPKLVK